MRCTVLLVALPGLDLGVLELPLELLVLRHLAHGLHEILVHNVVALCTDGKHAGLRAHVAKIGRVEGVCELDNRLVICARKGDAPVGWSAPAMGAGRAQRAGAGAARG